MTQRTRDPGHERRYFAMIPHLITDMLIDGEITTVAYSLYCYYRRRCGEHGDSFTESIRGTAVKLRRSVGTVAAARQELVLKGLIYLQLEGPVGHEIAEISIRDVWPENMAKYGPKRREGQDDEDSLRSNIERKSFRASGGDRTQEPSSVQILNATPDASVQLSNAPLTSSGKTLKNPEEEKPEDAAAAASVVFFDGPTVVAPSDERLHTAHGNGAAVLVEAKPARPSDVPTVPLRLNCVDCHELVGKLTGKGHAQDCWRLGVAASDPWFSKPRAEIEAELAQLEPTETEGQS